MVDNIEWFAGRLVEIPNMRMVTFPTKKLMKSWLDGMRATHLTLEEFCPYINECTHTVVYRSEYERRKDSR